MSADFGDSFELMMVNRFADGFFTDVETSTNSSAAIDIVFCWAAA
jgi:hypothetical protein